jgi:Domain of unknown function (DUF3472)
LRKLKGATLKNKLAVKLFLAMFFMNFLIGCSGKSKKEDEKKTGPFAPGGMAYGNYNWTNAVPTFNGVSGYKSSEISLKITQAPVSGSSYFWSSQFFLFEGDGGYIGLQDNGNINGKVVGKMAIFSFWNTLSASPGSEGTICQTFGGEGVGYSCRVPYNWEDGNTYRLRVYSNNISSNIWFGAIVDTKTGIETILGSITTPSTWKLLTPANAIFTEYFTNLENCAAVPIATAEFLSPSLKGVDDKLYEPSRVTSTYGNAICNNAKATVEGNKIIMVTGENTVP